MIRNLARKVMPVGVVNLLKRLELRIFGEDKRFLNLDRSKIFDSIYREGFWGTDKVGQAGSGSGSHNQKIVQDYLDAVRSWLSRFDAPPSVVDLGCGDFHVGSRIAPLVRDYLACDVSGFVIERNREQWSGSNARFEVLDLAEDEIPRAQVGIVRQVLQHLGNAEIQSFVEHLNRNKPFEYLLISEHLPLEQGFKPNLPKKTGPGIRLFQRSGVVLTEPPFCLEALDLEVLCEQREDAYGVGGVIRTIAYRLRCAAEC